MKQKTRPEIYLGYFRDSLLILQAAIHHFRQGEQYFYRIAALQLRLLLCDTVRRHNRLEDISLLPKVIPDCTLPPISLDGLQAEGIFLPLPEWLEQPVVDIHDEYIPVRDFIRRVCDQDGGAHIDPKLETGITAFPNRAEMIIRFAEVICANVKDPSADGR